MPIYKEIKGLKKIFYGRFILIDKDRISTINSRKLNYIKVAN